MAVCCPTRVCVRVCKYRTMVSRGFRRNEDPVAERPFSVGEHVTRALMSFHPRNTRLPFSEPISRDLARRRPRVPTRKPARYFTCARFVHTPTDVQFEGAVGGDGVPILLSFFLKQPF